MSTIYKKKLLTMVLTSHKVFFAEGDAFELNAF